MEFILYSISLILHSLFFSIVFCDCSIWSRNFSSAITELSLLAEIVQLTILQTFKIVTESLVKVGDDSNMLQDGLMVWLEEHLRRLQSGDIGTRVLRKSNSISLFPRNPPLCSTAVTNGVKVCTVVDPFNLYLFHFSDTLINKNKLFFLHILKW